MSSLIFVTMPGLVRASCRSVKCHFMQLLDLLSPVSRCHHTWRTQDRRAIQRALGSVVLSV